METIKVLDLFAGAGGLSLGFELVRNNTGKKVFELHRAVEIDKYACETLRQRYGSEKVIEGDVTKLAIANQIIAECKGKVSIVIGGIPCQSFSLIGPRSGFGKKLEQFKEDARDNLYEHFRDIATEIGPKIIVIENVKGILSKKDSEGNLIINKIITDFEARGFDFTNELNGAKYMLLNAANYGVPQKRERVILVGINRKWKACKVPSVEPTHYDATIHNEESIKKDLLPYVKLYEAIGDLPRVEPKITKTGLKKWALRRIVTLNRKRKNGIDRIQTTRTSLQDYLDSISPSGKKFFAHVRPNGYNYIDHHIARSQQFSDLKLFALMKQGETAEDFQQRAPKMAKRLIKYDMTSFLDKYRKQKADEVCTTLFAHLQKDGNRFIHPFQARTLTPREAARIQSFPDDYLFAGPISKKFKQIGNAVPPLLSKAVGEALLKVL